MPNRFKAPASAAASPTDHLDYLYPHASADPDGQIMVGDVIEEERELLSRKLGDDDQRITGFDEDDIEPVDLYVQRHRL